MYLSFIRNEMLVIPFDDGRLRMLYVDGLEGGVNFS